MDDARGGTPRRHLRRGASPRLREPFRPCDRLLLLPVYDAARTPDRSVNSDALAAKLLPGKCDLVADLDEAFDWITARRADYACFATCGARDPGLPLLAQRIAGLS